MERLSNALETAALSFEMSPTIYHLANSFVGMEAAIAFNDYLREYKNELTVEQLVNDGRADEANDWVINEHTAMVEKIKASKIFDNQLSSDQLQNVANYFVRIPSEVSMLLWKAMGDGTENQYNIVSFHDITAVNASGNKVSISDHIVSNLTAGQ